MPKEIKESKDKHARDESAPPVIRKINKSGKTQADPLRGLFETRIGGKRCVVEYEPDTDLRDTEQIPLLENGGIEAFLQREVLPQVPGAWYDPESVRTGYEISVMRRGIGAFSAIKTLGRKLVGCLAADLVAAGLLGLFAKLDAGGRGEPTALGQGDPAACRRTQHAAWFLDKTVGIQHFANDMSLSEQRLQMLRSIHRSASRVTNEESLSI